jgi:hypothetical protein
MFKKSFSCGNRTAFIGHEGQNLIVEEADDDEAFFDQLEKAEQRTGR